MSNTPHQPTTFTFTPKVENPVRHSSAHSLFVNEIVPKQLTVENCNKGFLFTTDANGNLTPWSPIIYFPPFGRIN